MAISISSGILIITLLVAEIFRATLNRITKVEDDFHEMMELKKRAEAADVAKSQVLVFSFVQISQSVLFRSSHALKFQISLLVNQE